MKIARLMAYVLIGGLVFSANHIFALTVINDENVHIRIDVKTKGGGSKRTYDLPPNDRVTIPGSSEESGTVEYFSFVITPADDFPTGFKTEYTSGEYLSGAATPATEAAEEEEREMGSYKEEGPEMPGEKLLTQPYSHGFLLPPEQRTAKQKAEERRLIEMQRAAGFNVPMPREEEKEEEE